jgi:hypothetical protein
MDASSSEVKNILEAVEGKFDLALLADDLYMWTQAVVGYLGLAKNSADKNLRHEQMSILFRDPHIKKEPTIEEVEKLFADKLHEMHFDKGKLDLHGLDHSSARILLTHHVKKGQLPTQIVCGIGSHSKTSNTQTMHKIVSDHLSSIKVEGDWQSDNGAITLRRDVSGRDFTRPSSESLTESVAGGKRRPEISVEELERSGDWRSRINKNSSSLRSRSRSR